MLGILKYINIGFFFNLLYFKFLNLIMKMIKIKLQS